MAAQDNGSDGSPAIRAVDLRVVRGGKVVIPDLTVEIPYGRVVGLLGPSGCGKTTLMRCVVGVQVLAGGSVEVLGKPAGHPDLRRRVGYMSQSASVYGDLTVKENLSYVAALVGVPRSRVPGEVGRVLRMVDLDLHGDARVDRLSGGEACRVSLAVALLGTPELLVLDEPTVGLDPVLRRDLWTIFRQLADERVTLLVSSHVMDEAGRCDLLLLMRGGELLANDSRTALLTRTGAEDMEGAFLALIEAAERGRSAAPRVPSSASGVA